MTSEIEDKEIGLKTLLTIIKIMKGSFAPFVESVCTVVLPLTEYSINETIRGVAAGILSTLV